MDKGDHSSALLPNILHDRLLLRLSHRALQLRHQLIRHQLENEGIPASVEFLCLHDQVWILMASLGHPKGIQDWHHQVEYMGTVYNLVSCNIHTIRLRSKLPGLVT